MTWKFAILFCIVIPAFPLVIPAKAGIQPQPPREASEMRFAEEHKLDSRLRENDGVGAVL